MNNKKKPEEVKNSAVELNDEKLENASGGYVIGSTTLFGNSESEKKTAYFVINDDNEFVSPYFDTREQAEKYVEAHKGQKGFEKPGYTKKTCPF